MLNTAFSANAQKILTSQRILSHLLLNLKTNLILLAKEKMTYGKFSRERLTNDSSNLMNICDLLSGGGGSIGPKPQKDTNYAAEKM